MSDALGIIITVAIVLAMISWASYVLFKRLKSGEPKLKSFWEWIKSIFEAIWGI